MRGNFEDSQPLAGGQITACGPILWDMPQDQGRVITRVDVRFSRDNDNVNGHSDHVTFRQGTDNTWTFTMDSNGFDPGPADAWGQFEDSRGKKVEWRDQVTIG